MENLNIDDDDSVSACDVMVPVCFELMTTFDTVSVLFYYLPLGLSDYLLVFQFHLAAPYEIVGGC